MSAGDPTDQLLSGQLREGHRGRVHAVAQSSRARSVVKNVALVSVALPARDRSARHAQGPVSGFDYILVRDRLPEAGPTGAGIEFGIRTEESSVTADATENAATVHIQQLAGEGPLCSCLTGDFKGKRRELLPPFRV